MAPANSDAGSLSELMGEHDRALEAYENALRHNPYSVKALTQVASLCRIREQFPKVPVFALRLFTVAYESR